METNIETHLALRHDAWRPMVPESSGDSPLPDTTEREVTLEALHSKLHDSGACDHSPEQLNERVLGVSRFARPAR